jgi:tetratricopeptide (TPR) repeat protein
LLLALACGALAFGCGGAEAPAVRASAPNAAPVPFALPAAPAVPAAPAPAPSLQFVEDDLAGATARARKEGKALFVDVWAPWCHTCLSMKRYVLTDPSLLPLAEKAVFVSLDSDRPSSAAFLERHAVKVWPTFYVLDPTADRVVGYWPGGASVGEIRALVDEAVRQARHAEGETSVASAHFAAAREAQAAGDVKRAAAEYQDALRHASNEWPDRSATLLGLIQSLYGAKAWYPCVEIGMGYGPRDVHGAALPTDFAFYLLQCAAHIPDGVYQSQARASANTQLRNLVDHPPPDASTDDRADTLDNLAEGLTAAGDLEGAKKAQEARLALLEQAAREAPTPELASTYDYGRATAYAALGRGDEAVRMLEERRRQFPDSYEPVARLADVLTKLGRPREALAAADRAIALAYGPRRLRYVKLRAELLGKLGDPAGELAALRDEVAGYEGLAPGQQNPEKLADARRRLDEAVRRGAGAGTPR